MEQGKLKNVHTECVESNDVLILLHGKKIDNEKFQQTISINGNSNDLINLLINCLGNDEDLRKLVVVALDVYFNMEDEQNV
jgi:hypothetical protein